MFGSTGNLSDFQVPQITQREKVMNLSIPLRPVLVFEVSLTHSLILMLIYVQFSLLNSLVIGNNRAQAYSFN